MKFILGHLPDSDFEKESIVQFSSKEEADFESEEWVEVEADSLEEAKDKYEETFENWQKEEAKK